MEHNRKPRSSHSGAALLVDIRCTVCVYKYVYTHKFWRWDDGEGLQGGSQSRLSRRRDFAVACCVVV